MFFNKILKRLQKFNILRNRLKKKAKKKIFLLRFNNSLLFFYIKRLKYFLISLKIKKKNFKVCPITKYKIYHNNKLFLNFFKLLSNLDNKEKISAGVAIYNKNILFIRKRHLKKKMYSKNIVEFKKNFFFDLYNKLLSLSFKFGKKKIWHLTISTIFENLSYILETSIYILLFKIFIRLFTRVELKRVKSRKRTTFIPFFIKAKRSIFLALKWIFMACLKDLNQTSFKNKLFIELSQILVLKTCFSIIKQEENCFNSYKNRANLHYRW